MVMATNGVSPKLVQNLRFFVRRLNSASASARPPSITVPALNYAEKHTTTDSPKVESTSPSDSILNFDDVKGLFAPFTTAKLVGSSITLHAAAVEPVVDFGTWVMNSKLIETAVLREIILGAIKHTVFKHFVAGENMREVGRTVRKLSDVGLKGMLDYALEHAADNESCDHNMNQFIQTVESVKSLPSSSVSFVVVKVTALCPISILRRVSDLLRWEYKDNSFHLPWKLNTLPIFTNSSPLYHTPSKPEPLTPRDEQDLLMSHERLEKICQKCLEANVPLVIDAEDTSIQPAIDYLTYSAAIKYNKENYKPMVFGTMQAYLKDSQERLLATKKAADKMGLPVGFKLVRGAYISSERQLASSLGVDSPIHNSIQETHDCYNECASFMIDEVVNGSGAVVLATHNVESGKMAASKARDLGIGKGNQKLQFAQLYGMSEALSFGLRNAGFDVSKYLPFGPVEQILPYLLRRAEENKGLLSASNLDRVLMRKELQGRLKAYVKLQNED